eukprot:TRINITY_DN9530_c0_g1_i1.p1 TRINITY_DN9530_c0_g1~~TRINITY_DN9530_c0_g1_i1.p1  ORF type:complete len:529 (+),score=96.64 TRINITY_DN9530_c0_g1_i1:115-1701(+)
MSTRYLTWVAVFLLAVGNVMAASNSLSDCQTFISNFRTTATGPVASITAATGTAVTCSGLTGSACPGSTGSGSCVFYSRLALSCSTVSGVTRIRVQSNGLPPRCSSMPSSTSFLEQDIDFTTNFNPQVSASSPNQQVSTQTAVDSLLCSLTTHSSAPSGSNLVNNNAANLQTLEGIAVDGTAIFNVNSANNQDPFYPTTAALEAVDSALSHPNGQIAGSTLHYHIMSAAALTATPSTSVTPCAGVAACSSSIKSYALSGFSTNYRNQTVYGILKDGHAIYGPYDSTGTQVTTSSLDVCGGMFYDSNGNYGYFATDTYPYFSGCFGPGNYPKFVASCTTNAPTSTYKPSPYVTAGTLSSASGSGSVTITITGNVMLGSGSDITAVKFGTTAGTIGTQTSTSVVVTVPTSLATGSYTVTVESTSQTTVTIGTAYSYTNTVGGGGGGTPTNLALYLGAGIGGGVGGLIVIGVIVGVCIHMRKSGAASSAVSPSAPPKAASMKVVDVEAARGEQEVELQKQSSDAWGTPRQS